MTRARVFALGLLCALVFSSIAMLAFPPVGWWWLAPAMSVPMGWCASRVVRGRARWAGLGAIAGASPVWLVTHAWVFGVSALGAPLLVAYLSAYAGLFVVCVAWIVRRTGWGAWAVAPVVWVAFEHARGQVVLTGYPWMLAGYPLIDAPGMRGAASVIGAYGASLAACALGFGVFGLVAARGRARLGAGAMVAGSIGVAAVGGVLPAPTTVGSIRIGVVQTNVPQSVKGGWRATERLTDLERMIDLTVEAATREPLADLVVWPETMFPGDSLETASLAQEREAVLVWFLDPDERWPELRRVVRLNESGEIERLTEPLSAGGRRCVPTTVAADTLLFWQRQIGTVLLVGGDGFDNLSIRVGERGNVDVAYAARFNSAMLVRDGSVVSRYDKVHLAPFGEVMPVLSRWEWLERTALGVGVGAAGMSFDLAAGTRVMAHEVQTSGGVVRVATPICFEGIMQGPCRRLVWGPDGRRAGLMVQMTNEGWFGGMLLPREHHLQITRWRAAELGTPLVRAANTGISAAIDASGRVVTRLVGSEGEPANVDGVLVCEVSPGVGGTVFARVGDLAGAGSLAGGAAMLAWAWWAGRRAKNGNGRARRRADRTDEEGAA